MKLSELIINDIKPLKLNDKVAEIHQLFNQLTFSHIPIQNDEGVYIGAISENDAHCFEGENPINDYAYALEGFYVRDTTVWLDILEEFAKNHTNIMPVLDAHNNYLGYYELNDVMSLFSETPFFHEPGAIIIVEKGVMDYSFSEISQIVESNNGKVLGAFLSDIENDVARITIKVTNTSINTILQTFRRYSYNIVLGLEEDSYLANLKERSDYLNRYLNM